MCAFTFYLVKGYPSPVEKVMSYMGDIGMSAVKHVVLEQFHLEEGSKFQFLGAKVLLKPNKKQHDCIVICILFRNYRCMKVTLDFLLQNIDRFWVRMCDL